MRFLGWLFTLGVYGSIVGVAMIAGVIWWYAQDDQLPSTEVLSNYEPPTLSRVHSGDGAVLAEYARERRLFTPIDEIPPLVKQAFISAEDKNFYHHSGVDWTGVAKAVVDNVFRVASGKRLRGASTITQQVVKNFLLSGERAVDRKIKEAILALRLEEAVTKEQILELYLNEIFLGVNSYGVTAATANYFGKRLEDLEPHEAAFLAALPADVPVTPLGLASNLILRDGGLAGVAIRLGRAFAGVERLGGDRLRLGAALPDARAAEAAADHGLAGLEFLRTSPGALGGAARMNAGCYGAYL
ncbi:MAG: transglycosylase domain-containing protein, partial [Pseudomonadota bacterium]